MVADVLDLLNQGSYKNWALGPSHPVFSDGPVPTGLERLGDYKTSFTLGEDLDLTGVAATAVWSDGRQADVFLIDIVFTGYGKGASGIQTMTAAYGPVKAEFKVAVLKPETSIKVSFTLHGR